jgi:hypothetical protein
MEREKKAASGNSMGRNQEEGLIWDSGVFEKNLKLKGWIR